MHFAAVHESGIGRAYIRFPTAPSTIPTSRTWDGRSASASLNAIMPLMMDPASVLADAQLVSSIKTAAICDALRN
jgi:hypothetical protein